jgi:hypothetical protein
VNQHSFEILINLEDLYKLLITQTRVVFTKNFAHYFRATGCHQVWA